MSDFTPGDGTHLMCQQCGHGNGLAIERYEFDFVSFAVLVDMHNGTDITCRQSLGGQVDRQNHAVMFFNHIEASKG